MKMKACKSVRFHPAFYISGLIEKLAVICKSKACTYVRCLPEETEAVTVGSRYAGKRVPDTKFFWGLCIGYWVSIRSGHSLPLDKSPWEMGRGGNGTRIYSNIHEKHR